MSDKGIKKWKLEVNSSPTFYAGSDKSKIKKLFFGEKEVIGINSETNSILTWLNSDECQTNFFPNEMIRSMLKLNESQVIFLLEATASSEDENEYHV